MKGKEQDSFRNLPGFPPIFLMCFCFKIAISFVYIWSLSMAEEMKAEFLNSVFSILLITLIISGTIPGVAFAFDGQSGTIEIQLMDIQKGSQTKK
jgi:hypothetical protein